MEAAIEVAQLVLQVRHGSIPEVRDGEN